MDETVSGRVPAWFWVVAGLACLWEAFGCFAYLAQVTTPPGAREGAYATMSDVQWSVFAIAVWSGLIGAIGLLLRRRWAIWGLLVSVVFALIQYGAFFATAAAEFVTPAAIGLPATIIIVGALLVWFARMAEQRGWLR